MKHKTLVGGALGLAAIWYFFFRNKPSAQAEQEVIPPPEQEQEQEEQEEQEEQLPPVVGLNVISFGAYYPTPIDKDCAATIMITYTGGGTYDFAIHFPVANLVSNTRQTLPYADLPVGMAVDLPIIYDVLKNYKGSVDVLAYIKEVGTPISIDAISIEHQWDTLTIV